MRNLFVLLLVLSLSCSVQESETSNHRFNHVMLYVEDIDESIAFYTTAFDMTMENRITRIETYSNDTTKTPIEVNMAILRFGDQNFVLEISQQPAILDTLIAKYQHLGIDVKNIDESLERALSAGAKEMRGVAKVEANGIVAKNAFMTGPSGEILELMEILEGEF